MKTILTAFVLFLISVPVSANSAGQTDWSGGPDVPGPVSPWGTSFNSAVNINFDTSPGTLSLSAPYGSHLIDYQRQYPNSVAIGDFNGDGNTDFAAVTAGGVYWWENKDGDGFSWTAYPISSTGAIRSWTFAYDFDKDGDLDFASSLSQFGLYWWENLGAGASWSEHLIQSAEVRGCCLGDFDNDGWMDIGLTIFGTADVLWWRNKLGTSHDWSANYIDGSMTGAYAIDAMQMDGAGGVDIVVGSNSTGQVAAYFNNLGSWDKELVDPAGPHARSVRSGDINGDGKYDVVGALTYGELTWWEQVSSSYWLEHIITDDITDLYCVGIADLNNDGHEDVLALNYGSGGELHWYQNNGSGSSWTLIDTFLSRNSYDMAIGDINSDGVPDILTASSANYNTIQQYRIGGFNTPGTLESTIYDTGAWGDINWDYLHWDAVEPSGTDLRVSIRGSANPSALGPWSPWISSPTAIASYLFSTDRYIQYRLELTTSSPWVAPTLNDITFLWSVTGIESGSELAEPLVLNTGNPSRGAFQMTFNLPEAGHAELSVFDLSGRLVSMPVSGGYETGTHSVLVDGLPSGIYVCRYSAPGVSTQLQVVVIE